VLRRGKLPGKRGKRRSATALQSAATILKVVSYFFLKEKGKEKREKRCLKGFHFEYNHPSLATLSLNRTLTYWPFFKSLFDKLFEFE
jgi:hypothetical protein